MFSSISSADRDDALWPKASSAQESSARQAVEKEPQAERASEAAKSNNPNRDGITTAKKDRADKKDEVKLSREASQLSEQDQRRVRELQQRDQQVRAHEMAHAGAGAGLVKGGPSYQYASGPDGKQYAIGGEVQIDTSPEKTPDATLRKAARVRSAALAPADPSPQDRRVAADADAMASAAAQQMAQQQSNGSNKPADGAAKPEGQAADGKSPTAQSQPAQSETASGLAAKKDDYLAQFPAVYGPSKSNKTEAQLGSPAKQDDLLAQFPAAFGPVKSEAKANAYGQPQSDPLAEFPAAYGLSEKSPAPEIKSAGKTTGDISQMFMIKAPTGSPIEAPSAGVPGSTAGGLAVRVQSAYRIGSGSSGQSVFNLSA